MGQVAHVTGIILYHQVRDRLPQIPQEPLGNLRGVHHAPRDHREEREQVIAPPRLELLAHLRGPVLRAVLPAIDVRRYQAGVHRTAFDAGIVHQLGHHPGEAGFNALLAQLVAFQPPAGFRSWCVFHPGARVAQPQHRPLALGHFPLQTPVAAHSRGQVDHPAAVNQHVCRQALPSRHVHEACLKQRLLPNTRNPMRADGGERQHRNVLVEPGHLLRLGRRAVKLLRAGQVGLAPDDLLHRLLRCDPRPAAAVPARVIVHVHFQAQPPSLRRHVLEQAAPLRAHEISRSDGRALVRLHDQHAPNSHALHRLQISSDAVTRDIAAEPEPIDPWPSGVGWLVETAFQVVRGRQVEGAEGRQGQDS